MRFSRGRKICSFTLLLAAFLFTTSFFSRNYPEIITADIVCPAWLPEHEPLKIVLFADLHLRDMNIGDGTPEKLVSCVNRLAPDLVLIAGDIFDKDQKDRIPELKERFIRIFSRLKSRFGIYAVFGNHDLHCGKEDAADVCSAAGIRILDRELVLPLVNGKPLPIYGTTERPVSSPSEEKQEIKLLGDLPSAPLILAHRPDFYCILPEEQPAVVLSGHTHGGLIRLPFLPGGVFHFLKTNRRREIYKKYARGAFQEGRKRLYVTSGLSGSSYCVRFNCPPEIVLLRITGDH